MARKSVEGGNPRQRFRAGFRDVVEALSTWLRTREGALPLLVLLRLCSTSRDWRRGVLSAPLYVDIGARNFWMNIKAGTPWSGLRVRISENGRPWDLEWVRGEEDTLPAAREVGRRDIALREAGVWPPVPVRHLMVAFDTLAMERSVELREMVFHGVCGLAKELLLRLHQRSPAAVMIWETAYTFMFNGGLDILQFDWPAYYRHWEWHADIEILREAARMWELTGPPTEEAVYAFLVFSIQPSVLLSGADRKRVRDRIKLTGAPVGMQVLPFGDLQKDRVFDHLNACGGAVTPEVDAALRVVFVRESRADELIAESVVTWCRRHGSFLIPNGREHEAETLFLQRIGFPLHDRSMAGRLPDGIEFEETIMLNTRRHIRLRDGVLSTRDEHVAAGGVPAKDVLRLRFGAETVDASEWGPPKVLSDAAV
jgi:hypothetical protein